MMTLISSNSGRIASGEGAMYDAGNSFLRDGGRFLYKFPNRLYRDRLSRMPKRVGGKAMRTLR